MNDKPVINAANLGPEELAAWFSEASCNARMATQDYTELMFELNSAERSLRFASENLATRINFLASDQIIRSADHSTAILEDLNTLRAISVGVRDTRQTILSSLAQLQQIEYQAPVPAHKVHL